MNLCNHCLNDCKCKCVVCHDYNNPNRRMIDYRCHHCNKKVPKMRKMCTECSTWLNLIQCFFFPFLSIKSRLRETIEKCCKKLKEKEKELQALIKEREEK